MTLNGVMAIILRYIAEFVSFCGLLRKSGWFLPRNVIKYTN